MISPKRYMLTLDDKVVDDGHPDARRLLVARGADIPDHEARAYGLLPPKDGGIAPNAQKSTTDTADKALPLDEDTPTKSGLTIEGKPGAPTKIFTSTPTPKK